MKESTIIALLLGLILAPLAALLIDYSALLAIDEPLLYPIDTKRVIVVLLWTSASISIAGFSSIVMAKAFARVATNKRLPGSTEARHRATLDVIDERIRQIKVEGMTTTHDDYHDPGELASAGSAYALAAADDLNPYAQGDGCFHETPPPMWPDGWEWKPKAARRALVCAAALLIAEIERIDRRGE